MAIDLDKLKGYDAERLQVGERVQFTHNMVHQLYDMGIRVLDGEVTGVSLQDPGWVSIHVAVPSADALAVRHFCLSIPRLRAQAAQSPL
ncbi:MAG: hypothetical protein AB7E98_21910 [Pirellulales bacterium]